MQQGALFLALVGVGTGSIEPERENIVERCFKTRSRSLSAQQISRPVPPGFALSPLRRGPKDRNAQNLLAFARLVEVQRGSLGSGAPPSLGR